MSSEVIYYSPSTNNFYSPLFSGFPTINILDPETVGSENPRVIEVVNPESTLPSDVISITSEEHQNLMKKSKEGMRIQPGVNGYPIAIIEPPRPPFSVTRRQGRKALNSIGKLQHVENFINSINDDHLRLDAKIEYEAETWEINNTFLKDMWVAMGGTEEELKNLFILAASF